MLKVIKNLFSKKSGLILLLIILTIPTFYRMLRMGIYSMQDFHFFRLFEFDKCIQVLQIPCRWTPDAGLGYGEPLFNFYGQFSYAIGEVFHLIGFNLVDSLKILFILSLLGSGIAMFFLSKRIWKSDLAAILSSILYVYAPYRAVDVWVRGALPEAFSFIFLPLILLFIDRYIETKRNKDLGIFSILVSLLIITHNLSFVMFVPVLAVWIIYKLYSKKDWKILINIISALFISFLLSAFYVLPVLFESKFIDLRSTTVGYFDYRAHFATIPQLLLSRFWGYGGSTWGIEDGISLSVGQLQWLLPLIGLLMIILNKKSERSKDFLVILTLGWFFLFLTHNKSTFIWNNIPGMAYIQFPWRFLGVATFCFALSSGILITLFKKYQTIISSLLVVCTIILNIQFFKEDIWYRVDDSYFTTGAEWDRQRVASIRDYWPMLGHEVPNTPNDGTYINYFPGWISQVESKDGLIPAQGSKFTDTPIRKAGNVISLATIVLLGVNLVKTWKKEA